MKNRITLQELETLLRDINKCSFIGITYETEPNLKKTNNPFMTNGQTITKITVENCLIGFDYTRAVQKRIEGAGGNPNEWVGEKLPWGTFIHKNILIHHVDKTGTENTYLRYYKTHKCKKQSTYFVDGVEATAEQLNIINTLLPTYKPSTKQLNAGINEDKQVKPQTVKLNNIKEIAVDKQLYTVVKNNRKIDLSYNELYQIWGVLANKITPAMVEKKV